MSNNRYWDVWQNKSIVDEVIPALGSPEKVFGGKVAHWWPKGVRKILDVGCGNGVYYPFLSKHGKYVGIDTSQFMIDKARETYPDGDFRIGDAFAIDFDDNTFSLVWSNAVLIHIPIEYSLRIINELYRVSNKYIIFNAYVAETDYIDYVRHGELGILQVWGEKHTLDIINNYNAQIVEKTPVSINNITAETWRFFLTKKKT